MQPTKSAEQIKHCLLDSKNKKRLIHMHNEVLHLGRQLPFRLGANQPPISNLWNDDERKKFDDGIVEYGWGNWKQVNAMIVRTSIRVQA